MRSHEPDIVHLYLCLHFQSMKALTLATKSWLVNVLEFNAYCYRPTDLDASGFSTAHVIDLVLTLQGGNLYAGPQQTKFQHKLHKLYVTSVELISTKFVGNTQRTTAEYCRLELSIGLGTNRALATLLQEFNSFRRINAT